MTVSPLYPQDGGETGINSETKGEVVKGVSGEEVERLRGETDHGSRVHREPVEPSTVPGSEVYSPYPPNFIIPKGVCEKSEPVLIINNKK